MNTDEFSKRRFAEANESQRGQMCSDLARALEQRLVGAGDFHRAILSEVERLRELGHDLWSMDESDDFEVWGPNYESTTGPGVVITFTCDQGVRVEWTHQ